jgi:hypothetical protein
MDGRITNVIFEFRSLGAIDVRDAVRFVGWNCINERHNKKMKWLEMNK